MTFRVEGVERVGNVREGGEAGANGEGVELGAGGLEGGGESVVVRGDEGRGVDLGEEEGD